MVRNFITDCSSLNPLLFVLNGLPIILASMLQYVHYKIDLIYTQRYDFYSAVLYCMSNKITGVKIERSYYYTFKAEYNGLFLLLS